MPETEIAGLVARLDAALACSAEGQEGLEPSADDEDECWLIEPDPRRQFTDSILDLRKKQLRADEAAHFDVTGQAAPWRHLQAPARAPQASASSRQDANFTHPHHGVPVAAGAPQNHGVENDFASRLADYPLPPNDSSQPAPRFFEDSAGGMAGTYIYENHETLNTVGRPSSSQLTGSAGFDVSPGNLPNAATTALPSMVSPQQCMELSQRMQQMRLEKQQMSAQRPVTAPPGAGLQPCPPPPPPLLNGGVENAPFADGKDNVIQPIHLAKGLDVVAAAAALQLQPQRLDGCVTMMMGQLPLKYTQRKLIKEINNLGFVDHYDFFYLPTDPRTHNNRGFAFISFEKPGVAEVFFDVLHGKRLQEHFSNLALEVKPADIQGFEENAAHFSKTAGVRRKNGHNRPLFFRKLPEQLVNNQLPAHPGSILPQDYTTPAAMAHGLNAQPVLQPYDEQAFAPRGNNFPDTAISPDLGMLPQGNSSSHAGNNLRNFDEFGGMSSNRRTRAGMGVGVDGECQGLPGDQAAFGTHSMTSIEALNIALLEMKNQDHRLSDMLRHRSVQLRQQNDVFGSPCQTQQGMRQPQHQPQQYHQQQQQRREQQQIGELFPPGYQRELQTSRPQQVPIQEHGHQQMHQNLQRLQQLQQREQQPPLPTRAQLHNFCQSCGNRREQQQHSFCPFCGHHFG